MINNVLFLFRVTPDVLAMTPNTEQVAKKHHEQYKHLHGVAVYIWLCS